MELDSPYPLDISHKKVGKNQVVFSIYNMHPLGFFDLLNQEIFESLEIYWHSDNKEFKSTYKKQLPATTISNLFAGQDVSILSVEILFSNRYLVDTNMIDEIFCRTPSTTDIDEFEEKVKKKHQSWHYKADQPHVDDEHFTDADMWVTIEIPQ